MKTTLDFWRGTSPWSMLADMDRVFNHVLPAISSDASRNSVMGFNPACEIEEHDDHFFLSMDLPGVTKDDLKIEVLDSRLVISGERKNERREGEWRSERSYGRFERSFALPPTIDADKIEARYENGVLELAVPKAESAKPRSIQIGQGKEGFLGRFLNRSKTAEAKSDKNPKDWLAS